jgi:hypothetical protein
MFPLENFFFLKNKSKGLKKNKIQFWPFEFHN